MGKNGAEIYLMKTLRAFQNLLMAMRTPKDADYLHHSILLTMMTR
jgi:hypothetical protein